jgi:uncharacterized protein (TIGR03118 family)
MNVRRTARNSFLLLSLAIASTFAIVLVGAAQRTPYQSHVLVSDGSIPSDSTDSTLRSSWGLAHSTTGAWWISNNGSQMVLVYDGNGVQQPVTVQVPGAPTGIVHNPTGSFVITEGAGTGPARFLIASQDGTISACCANTEPSSGSLQAQVVVDSRAKQAVYTGLALGTALAGDRLYAANFHNGTIDVFDRSFQPVLMPGAFLDNRIPEGFAPFGIQQINGRLLVTYAKQSPDLMGPIVGNGLGFVDVYDLNGTLLTRATQRGQLNAPWGVAIAPASFGEFGGHVLVSNFGDGQVLAYKVTDDLMSFKFAGVLRDQNNKPIEIQGLRGIGFGNGQIAGPMDTLFFAAGPNAGQAGAFGRIDVVR